MVSVSPCQACHGKQSNSVTVTFSPRHGLWAQKLAENTSCPVFFC